MKIIRIFYLIFFQFLEVKFSIYSNRRVFVMEKGELKGGAKDDFQALPFLLIGQRNI